MISSEPTGHLVWLVRHGQSQANAGAATDHPKTIALTALGQTQASAVAERVKQRPDQIIVSPYERTLQTAQPLLDQLREQAHTSRVLTWPIHEFTYLSPVRCRGTTVIDRRDWAQAYWQRADPDWEDGDGAESFRQLMRRVDVFSEQLKQLTGFTVVYGHGMFFKAFLIGLTHGTQVTAQAMTRYRALESADPVHNGQIIPVTLVKGRWELHESL